MTTQTTEQTNNDFNLMKALVINRVDGIHSGEEVSRIFKAVKQRYPEQLPKVAILEDAIRNHNWCFSAFDLADIVAILRDFQTTDDFEADVERLLTAIADSHALAEFRAAEATGDELKAKAKLLFDQYGKNATWADVLTILAE
jgi:hypothetical protein